MTLNLDDENYFTIFYGIIDCETKEFKYSNAGHNCVPILFNSDRLELLKMRGYPISTIFNEISYDEGTVNLRKSDRVLFYTDGITEVRNRAKKQFGVEGIIEVIKNNKRNLLNNINNKVDSFKWGDLDDDYALVLIELV